MSLGVGAPRADTSIELGGAGRPSSSPRQLRISRTVQVMPVTARTAVRGCQCFCDTAPFVDAAFGNQVSSKQSAVVEPVSRVRRRPWVDGEPAWSASLPNTPPAGGVGGKDLIEVSRGAPGRTTWESPTRARLRRDPAAPARRMRRTDCFVNVMVRSQRNRALETRRLPVFNEVVGARARSVRRLTQRTPRVGWGTPRCRRSGRCGAGIAGGRSARPSASVVCYAPAATKPEPHHDHDAAAGPRNTTLKAPDGLRYRPPQPEAQRARTAVVQGTAPSRVGSGPPVLLLAVVVFDVLDLFQKRSGPVFFDKRQTAEHPPKERWGS